MSLAGDVVTPVYTALTRSQILVLTGAGASVPLGMPAMDKFVQSLEDEFRGFALQICVALGPHNNDLELLLGRLSYYENMQKEARDDGQFRAVVNVDKLDELVKRAHQLREHIFDRIIATYGVLSAEAAKKAVELYHDLYLRLLPVCGSEPSVLPIFTTNYDLTFEAIEERYGDFSLCTGLDRIGVNTLWSPDVYKKQQGYNFAIFRLHGCSHWIKRRKSENIFFQSLPDRKDLGNKEPCVLYPLLNKENRIDEEPFRTGYHHLRTCLASAKTVVVIGYSGRDPAVQERFEEALGADPDKNFVVVTAGQKLRPELERLKRLAKNFHHLSGGIEANTQKLLDVGSGMLNVDVASSTRH